ncbi:hypothetical protein H4W19_14700 [Pseudoxanthomonas mexicana]|uniref:Uncharacterized protein n=1 Tax=Pseudoxanthomonas mexicana TaxID=128785 RepID=A0ABX6R8P2_PSEMX|nr:hypothetical protein [Pseudoxanthomonas mexicana]QND79580.1 hypothetical protein H4W19_14700 [Pseudoxanthomonas mexicana]
MRTLWEQYVFQRGANANELWERLFQGRATRLLYIAGSGFDVRAQGVMREFIDSIKGSGAIVEDAKLILIGFAHYRLDEDLESLTEQNATRLAEIFSAIGSVETVSFRASDGDEDLSASISLRLGTDEVVNKVTTQTDIILDASSLPRVIYLALMTSLLNRLIPDRDAENALAANGVNFQVLVAEDAGLDSKIMAEDPSSEIVMVPGFSGAMQVESFQDLPLVWFPILGEHRVNQLQIMRSTEIPGEAEICPVLPHPSRDPRRADRLLVEYKEALFDSRRTPTSNILYVHESQPFEAYRQLLGAMRRYKESMEILGGCRLVVTPFGSKLVTLGVGLACFEMRPSNLENASYGVAIPHAEPTRYVVDARDVRESQPEICCLLLTGEAYA